MREEEEMRERRPEVRAIDVSLPCTFRVINVLRNEHPTSGLSERFRG